MKISSKISFVGGERVFGKMTRKVRENTYQELRRALLDARRFAKAIAPVQSGKTMRAISFQSQRSTLSGTLVGREGHRDKTWGNEEFRLTEWMHTSPRALSHIKSGEPRFIYETTNDLRRKINSKFYFRNLLK